AAPPAVGVHGAPSVWPAANSNPTIDAARSQNVGLDVRTIGLIARPPLIGCRCCRNARRVQLQERAPAARRRDRRSHPLTVRTHALEAAMLELDARPAVAGVDEAH